MIQFQRLVENMMSEEGMNVPSELRTNIGMNQSMLQDENWTLKIGDQISLFMEMDQDGSLINIFMSASGATRQSSQLCGIGTGKNQTPSNFIECVFIVHNPNQYSAATEYQKKLDLLVSSRRGVGGNSGGNIGGATQQVLSSSSSSASLLLTAQSTKRFNVKRARKSVIAAVTRRLDNESMMTPTSASQAAATNSSNNFIDDSDTELKTLQIKYEQEMEQNRVEAERAVGREVLYGQPIQLLHLKSNKFLTVARESAQLQKECVRLVLDDLGNSNSVFYIAPYYKFRTEGQKVLISDQVRLMSRKTSLYIHLSKLKFDEKKREVNMSTALPMTKWRMRLFTSFIDPNTSKRFLKAGDVIRLYHQESNGYLDVDLERSNTVKMFLDKDAKKSSNTMWEVELSDPSRGGILDWYSMYRFRHVATGRYLTVRLPVSDSDSEDDDDVTPWEVKTDKTKSNPRKFTIPSDEGDLLAPVHASNTSANPITSKWNILRKKVLKDKGLAEPSSPTSPALQPEKKYDLFVDDLSTSSLFTVQSPNTGSMHIQTDSFMRIQHSGTNSWIRSVPTSSDSNSFIRREAFKSLKRRRPQSSHSKIECSTQMAEEDAFAIRVVPQTQVEDLLFIQSTIPVLDHLRHRLKSRSSYIKSEVQKVTATLAELCLFCTDSTEQDPMIREGIPYSNRQNYLREQLILHKVMDIIRFLDMGADELQDERRLPERELIKHAYRFIKQSVKQNHTNGLHMSTYISFIQSQLPISGIGGINVSQALTEILTNNYELLNNMSEGEVKYFVDLLFEGPRVPDHVAFLNAVSCTDDRPIVRNQDIIRDKLFEDVEKMKNRLIIPYMNNNRIYVSIDGDVLEFKNFVSDGLSTGSRTRYGRYMLEFAEHCIELFSRLCMGRNIFSIDSVSKLIDLDVILTCIKDTLTPKLSSSFCNMLLHCYIDRAPYERRPLIKLTRSWHKDTSKDKKKRDILATKTQDVKSFIIHFFVGNQKLDKSALELNQFILTLTKIARSMLEFRIISDINEIDALTSYLFKLLDGSTDRDRTNHMSNKARYAADEQNAVVTAIKLEICKIFNLFIDISLNRKISFFVNDFKIRAQDTDTSMLESNREQLDMELIERIFAYKLNKKPSTYLDSDTFKRKLLEVLQDLQRYENPSLGNYAMNLLFRLHNQKEELARYLLRVEMLVSRSMVRSYNELNNNTSKLRNLLVGDAASRLRESDAQKAKELMQEICKEARSAGGRAQRIMRNLKVHKIAMQTLKQNFFESETRQLLWKWSIRLLIEFVRQNPTNQKLIWPHLETFYNKLQIPETCSLLSEIVKGNRDLCLAIEEKQIRAYIDAFAEQELAPRFLVFLRTLVITEGKPVKKNQTFVVNNLSQRSKDVVVLFAEKAGLRERNKRIARNEHINEPEGILNYHIELLHLMCDCAEGNNHVPELKLQAMLSIDGIIEQLIDPMLIPAIRNPLTRFLNEVYINTEKDSLKFAIQTNEKLWVLLEKMNDELEYFISGKQPIQDTITILENNQTIPSESTSTAISVSDHSVGTGQNKAQSGVDNHYVYKLLIPFVHFYFFKHFPPPIVLEHHEKISNQIIVNLKNLYAKTANPNQREGIKKCAQAMYKKRLNLRSSSTAMDKFFARLMIDTSKPVQFTREIRHKLDEKDEQLCNQLMNRIKQFEPLLLSQSDMKNATLIYQSEESLRTLIVVLRRLNDTGYDEFTKLATLHALRTLQGVIQKAIDSNNSNEVETVLRAMTQVNAHLLVIDLVCCPHDLIVKEAFNLGILLLHEGNNNTQKCLLYTLIDSDSERFFIALRNRIRRAIGEIKLRRSFMKKRLEHLKALNESNKVVNLADLKKRDANNVKKLQEEVEAAYRRGSDVKLAYDQFVETGFIREILRLLQLMTEGHNLPMQEYLNNQIFNNVSVNLVQECLHYLLALANYIDTNTVSVAIQCLETLTEFIQGPCRLNQNDIGMRPNLYFAANEMLQSDNLDPSLPALDVLKLRTKLILTLSSLLEGNRNNALYILMRNSLNCETLQMHLLEAAEIQMGTRDELLLTKATRDWNTAFDLGLQCPRTPSEMVAKLKKGYEKFGLSIYFLLNTFQDQKLSASTREKDLDLTNWMKQHKTQLAYFASLTGRIEVSRNNQLERVYFRKPEISKNLIEQTKHDFVYSCNRESAQSKVFDLYNATNKFRIEMEHYAEFKLHSKERRKKATLKQRIDAAMWSFFERYWHQLKLLVFLYAVLMNTLVCTTMKRTYDTVGDIIPIPGVTSPSESAMHSDFTHGQIEVLMFVLGALQIVMAVVVICVHSYFFAKLRVKKQFDLGKTDRWQDIEFNLPFVRRYLFYSFKDRQLWFFMFYVGVCLIGWLVTPSVYCLLLFEVVSRSSSLKNVLFAVKRSFKQLALTGVLMLFVIFFFSILYFTYRHQVYANIGDDHINACETLWECTQAFIYWNLRDEGLPEGGNTMNMPLYIDFPRSIIDLSYACIVPIVLMEMVFGLTLDSFAELRKEREEKEALIHNQCFICDIEKERFDTKANENITFQDHIKNDHYMWNYVFFLIYLFRKKHTEFTGTEQYIHELAMRDDLSFFPILRSLTLEESDLKHRIKHARSLKAAAGLVKARQDMESNDDDDEQEVNDDEEVKEEEKKQERKKPVQQTGNFGSPPRSPTLSRRFSSFSNLSNLNQD